MAPCDAFLSMGSMLASSVMNRPGGEGQCSGRSGRCPPMPTCHLSPRLQHSSLSFPLCLCCYILSQRNMEATQIQIVLTVTEIMIKHLLSTALLILCLVTQKC